MEALRDILHQFDVPGEGISFEPAEHGLINTTYFVRFGNERRYVMQRVNQNVFPNTRSLFHNLERTLPHLSSSEYVQVHYLHTRQGKMYFRSESNELWRVMSYLPGCTSFHTTSDRDVAFEAGRIVGLFHSQLSLLDPKELQITLARFHSLEWRMEQYNEALKMAKEKDVERTSDLKELVEEMAQRLTPIQAMDLPVRVCHNDTKLNNILFGHDKRALCLIDLDTLMPGLLLYDFGDAVRTLANPAPEEETDLDKIGFSMKMFVAFVEGMALFKSEFSPVETQSLSLGPVYMPFLHGLRAYTDFLLGNVYYKVAYPDQNLHRARSLFHFAKLALEQELAMREIIQQKMM